MIALPFALPVIFPLLSTVAIFILEDFHFTVLSVLSDGETVAFSVSVLPTVTDKLVLFNFTVLGETFTTTFLKTLTLSFAVAVMVADPVVIPLIFPLNQLLPLLCLNFSIQPFYSQHPLALPCQLP